MMSILYMFIMMLFLGWTLILIVFGMGMLGAVITNIREDGFHIIHIIVSIGTLLALSLGVALVFYIVSNMIL